jgi:hypothetical protein
MSATDGSVPASIVRILPLHPVAELQRDAQCLIVTDRKFAVAKGF